jgi:hypothetical protein
MQDEKVLTVYSSQKTQNPNDTLSSRWLAVPGFYRSLGKGISGDVSYRELYCDTLCDTLLEAMASAHNLLPTLSIRYGFNPLSCIRK